MFHSSPELIVEGTINELGVAGSCLFFSDHIYVMTASSAVYVYEAEFECIRASQLYDEQIVAEIAAEFGVDEDTAEALLDGSESEWDNGADAEDSWWLQGKRGECAVRMGYDGCEDVDEQGTVYIVPMQGRENELKLVKKRRTA